MKKSLILMLLAVVTICFTACKDKAGDAKNENANEIVFKNTFNGNGENFSLGYPDELKEAYTDETTFTAETADKDCRMSAVLQQEGDFADLNKCVEAFKEEPSEDEKFEEPTINGNVMTIKSVNLGEVCKYFVVKKDENTAVVGKYYYRESKAADYEKYFDPIVKSVAIQ